MEEVLFKSEEKLKTVDAADKISKIAERIVAGKLALEDGQNSVDLDIPDNVELEVKVEREGSETSVELEVEWDERGGKGSVEIG